jgi:hypothetical protein
MVLLQIMRGWADQLSQQWTRQTLGLSYSVICSRWTWIVDTAYVEAQLLENSECLILSPSNLPSARCVTYLLGHRSWSRLTTHSLRWAQIPKLELRIPRWTSSNNGIREAAVIDDRSLCTERITGVESKWVSLTCTFAPEKGLHDNY